MFGDAVLDAIRYRGGGGGLYTETVGYLFVDCSPGKAYATKWRALGFGVAGKMAVQLGWSHVVLVTDSQTAACHFLSLRVSKWLNRQKRLLCALMLHSIQHPLFVEVRLV